MVFLLILIVQGLFSINIILRNIRRKDTQMHKSPKETKERNDQKQQSNKQDTDNKQSKEAKILSG